MSGKSPILTSYVHPPIPTRRFDWAAYRDPESKLCGWGPTPEAAIADLLEEEAVLAEDNGE